MSKELSIIETELLSIIPRVKDNIKSIKTIGYQLGLDERTTQSIVSRLVIKYGIPICSTREKELGSGIFIPLTPKERMDGLRNFKSQAINMIERVKVVESADLNNWTDDLVYKYQEKLKV
ncbi:hypothetical protein [Acinetobacter baumannii]|uniref:hypothetical protein n=1 Tax=Acinetobacter baumannii TaxID=470 RepID=UPI001AECC166|nr:hypothetical protein [Acinetobacter baumannii]MBP2966853.1 hypothetical protein [Acinetobacter baumannii]